MDFLRSETDFFTSVEKALNEIDPKWKEYQGMLIVGSHAPMQIEEKLEKIKYARENKIPFLGICLGMQLAIVEFARNVLGLKNANSIEIDPNTLYPVVTKLPNLRVGIYLVYWTSGNSMESHWHNYAFNNDYREQFDEYFSISDSDKIVEIMQLNGHPFFTGVQFHPEYQSSKGKPHPLLKQFVEICKHTAVGHNL